MEIISFLILRGESTFFPTFEGWKYFFPYFRGGKYFFPYFLGVKVLFFTTFEWWKFFLSNYYKVYRRWMSKWVPFSRFLVRYVCTRLGRFYLLSNVKVFGYNKNKVLKFRHLWYRFIRKFEKSLDQKKYWKSTVGSFTIIKLNSMSSK